MALRGWENDFDSRGTFIRSQKMFTGFYTVLVWLFFVPSERYRWGHVWPMLFSQVDFCGWWVVYTHRCFRENSIPVENGAKFSKPEWGTQLGHCSRSFQKAGFCAEEA